MNLVVLASGRGSRLGRITKNKPKCLVKVNKKKTILDHISENFYLFEKVIIVTGYKAQILKNKYRKKKIEFVHNKNYATTNMVESLMLTQKIVNKKDTVVLYSDIFFDPEIIKETIAKKGNILPLNINWLKSWKKRYKTLKKIKIDAEDLKVSKGKIISIGKKIDYKLPKYQYMGIIKISFKAFQKLNLYYKTLKNQEISMTEFINSSILSKIVYFGYFRTKKYWYEIDNYNDLKFLRKDFLKLF